MDRDLGARLDKLIELLETVRKHPGMFMGRAEPDLVTAFLTGVSETAQSILEIDTRRDVRWGVWRERGWDKGGARGPVAQMQQSGLSAEAVVDEMIVMEIEVLKRVRTPAAPGLSRGVQ